MALKEKAKKKRQTSGGLRSSRIFQLDIIDKVARGSSSMIKGLLYKKLLNKSGNE